MSMHTYTHTQIHIIIFSNFPIIIITKNMKMNKSSEAEVKETVDLHIVA